MKLYFPLLVVLLLSLISCDDDPGCDLELPHDDVELVFYDIETLLDTSFTFSGAGVLDNDPADGNLVYYTSDDTLSNYSMQLNPATDEITYFFTSGVFNDTLILRYDRNLIWISEKCGPFMNYDELEIIHSTFDSISLINSIIDESISENIQIYR